MSVRELEVVDLVSVSVGGHFDQEVLNTFNLQKLPPTTSQLNFLQRKKLAQRSIDGRKTQHPRCVNYNYNAKTARYLRKKTYVANTSPTFK
jgi:hypothetical protein